MKSQSLETLKRGLAVGLAIAITTGPLAAGGPPPDNLSDLFYQDKGWSESQLRSRGYSLQHSDRHRGATWQYWWHGRNHTCL